MEAPEDLAPPAEPSRIHRLIDERLAANDKPTLWEIVANMRPTHSWRTISAEVHRMSGEYCSDVNLIRWFTRNDKAAA